MVATVVFRGTRQEQFELQEAIAHHCKCEFGLMGVRISTCGPHDLLLHDQRAIDGLLFVRSQAARLVQEEDGPQTPVVPGVTYRGMPRCWEPS